MPVDRWGRDIKVRGRQFYGTKQDAADMAELVLDAYSDARLFYDVTGQDCSQHPITVEEFLAMEVAWNSRLEIEFEPRDSRSQSRTLGGFPIVQPLPMPLFSIRWSTESVANLPEIGLDMTRFQDGLLNSNELAHDPTGKKMVDKVFRMSRKVLSRAARWVDLKTGTTVEYVRFHDWYGRHLARRCREEKDTYIILSIRRDEDRFWGLLPAE